MDELNQQEDGEDIKNNKSINTPRNDKISGEPETGIFYNVLENLYYNCNDNICFLYLEQLLLIKLFESVLARLNYIIFSAPPILW